MLSGVYAIHFRILLRPILHRQVRRVLNAIHRHPTKTNVTNECSGRYSDKIKAQPWRSCTSCISLRCPWFFAHWIWLKHSWKHERSWRQCGYSGHLGHQHISIWCPWVVQAKNKTKSNNSIKDYQQLIILILHSCAIFSWQMPSNTVFWFAMVYCHSFTSPKPFPIFPFPHASNGGGGILLATKGLPETWWGVGKGNLPRTPNQWASLALSPNQ